MAEEVVHVRNVSKTFKLPHERQGSVKNALINLRRKRKGYEKQQVLDNVSFSIKKGEFFGIVGRNGSGKSTLLKLLAGIYTPDKGSIEIQGKLTPFIELGVGFNPELTGRENVYLNGALLGFNHKEMDTMYDEIVAFAELERFMDQKLKNYSSGMQVRLAFSIAIQAQTDILLIDEVLAVGDVNFQNKCLAVFEDYKRKGVTVIFVSHDMEAVRRFCDRAVMLESGKITQEGNAQQIIDRYFELNSNVEIDPSVPFGVDKGATTTQDIISIISTNATSQKGTQKVSDNDKEYSVELRIKFLADCSNYIPGVVLRNHNGVRVTASNTEWVNCPVPKGRKGDEATFRFTFPNVLERGIYFVSTNVAFADGTGFYAWDNDATTLKVDRPFQTGGLVNKYQVEVL
jgi:ABC-2 type transport system ATP-binding protein